MPSDPRGVAFAKRSALEALSAKDGADDDGNDGAEVASPDAENPEQYDCTCPKCGEEFAVTLDDSADDAEDVKAKIAGKPDNDSAEMDEGESDEDPSDETGFRMGAGRS